MYDLQTADITSQTNDCFQPCRDALFHVLTLRVVSDLVLREWPLRSPFLFRRFYVPGIVFHGSCPY